MRWVVEAMIDNEEHHWAYVRKMDVTSGHIMMNYNFEECFVREYHEAVRLAKQVETRKTARIREIETGGIIMACIL